MPSQITSGIPLNQLAVQGLNQPKPVISSPLRRLRAIHNQQGGPSDRDDSSIRTGETAATETSQTNRSNITAKSFSDMTLTELGSLDPNSDLPPNSNDFKAILFNSAIETGLFSFKPGVLSDIKGALISGSCPSHKYLASVAVSLAQSETAIKDLRDQGKIDEGQFRSLHNDLKNYAQSLSDLGNKYQEQLLKKPGQDIHHAFLVVKNHRNNQFTKLFTQAAKIEAGVKSLVNSHPEIKSIIRNQMNSSVCDFIHQYFKPEQTNSTSQWHEFDNYIKAGAKDKIIALFRDESRNRPGHQFDAGGTEHLQDCFAEIFDHFKTLDEVNRVFDMPPTPLNTPGADEVDGPPGSPFSGGSYNPNLGPGITNTFSPVFNPVNSPNFYNNINETLSSKLDDSNRLLEKILQNLTPKSTVSQETQTDPALKHDVGTDAVSAYDEVDFGGRRTDRTPSPLSNFADSIRGVKMIPINTNPEQRFQTPNDYRSQRFNLNGYAAPLIVGQDELSKVKLRPTKTREPATFTVNSGYRERHYFDANGGISSGLVSDRRAAYEEHVNKGNASQPQMTQNKTDDTIDTTSQPVKSTASKKAPTHSQIVPETPNVTTSELDKVHLKPTKTRDPLTFPVNSRFQERDFFTEQGNINTGLVSDRMKSFATEPAGTVTGSEEVFHDISELHVKPAQTVLTATLMQQDANLDTMVRSEKASLTSHTSSKSASDVKDASGEDQTDTVKKKRSGRLQNYSEFLAHVKGEKGKKII